MTAEDDAVMSKAAGYTRLSQKSDTSIARQMQHIREYAEDNEFELVEILDDGQKSSGFDVDRAAYQELKQWIRDGDLDAIIVNDMRRLARDVDEVMRLVPDLRTQDIKLHTFEDGPLDLSDPMKAAIEILQAAAAHEEKLKEIRKSIEATNERLEAGYDHGRPRFGMEYGDDGQYQVPGDDFETVEEIFELRDSGATYDEMVSKLGVPRGTIASVLDSRDWYDDRAPMSHN